MPADPPSKLERFARRGMAWMQNRAGRTATLGTKTVKGIRTDVDLDPKSVRPGGKIVVKAWRFTVPLSEFGADPIPGPGTKVTDDVGDVFKIYTMKSDAVTVTYSIDNIVR